MSQIKVLEEQKSIEVNIPLTTTSGKIRIKNRSSVFEYGIPFATKQKNFSQSNYVEWQIGYDAVVNEEEKIKLTTLPSHTFKAYNGKEKALYELSEYLFYFVKWGVIKKDEISSLKNYLEKIKSSDLVENNPNCQIKRTHPKEVILNDVPFYESKVEYPLLVHKFKNYEIIAEIIVREKQRAIGTQAMLFFCFPITELEANPILLGRSANSKEIAKFVFDENNCKIILEMVRVFGMLSESHRKDILAIIDIIIEKL